MGTSSTALFADDVACDVRDEFIESLSTGATPVDVTQSLIQSWDNAIQDADDGPVFWLALAATQWKYGCLDDNVQTHAIEIIDSGVDLKRWAGSSAARRQAVLSSLRAKLLSPQPAFRKPARRKPLVIPSNEVPSPDGRALATAYKLGAYLKNPNTTTERMQVYIEMEASDSWGGGGVFVADCEFNEVSLTWMDSETLQIVYPASATVSDKKPSIRYCDRTIKIVYGCGD
ncbi:MAG: hypothetical protein LBQ75_06355 [Zoogloeaceae bacterium]|jgi:hypothetical protein|nr:hypothetical protein [Zoogloeaceae bacterium]